MSFVYPILKWDQTIDASNALHPILFFTPDDAFLQYLQDNPDYPIPVLVSGTGGIYDGPQYARCISSANYQNYGPNYYFCTGHYILVLDASFSFYPTQEHLGAFQISYETQCGALLEDELGIKDGSVLESFIPEMQEGKPCACSGNKPDGAPTDTVENLTFFGCEDGRCQLPTQQQLLEFLKSSFKYLLIAVLILFVAYVCCKVVFS